MICPHCGMRTSNLKTCDHCGESTIFIQSFQSVGSSRNIISPAVTQDASPEPTPSKSHVHVPICHSSDNTAVKRLEAKHKKQLLGLASAVILLALLCVVCGITAGMLTRRLHKIRSENLQLRSVLQEKEAAESVIIEILFDLNPTAEMGFCASRLSTPSAIRQGEASPSVQNAFDPVSGREWCLTGWNTNADGSGFSIKPNQSVDLPISKTIMLYAQWEEVFEPLSETSEPVSGVILLDLNPAEGMESCASRLSAPSAIRQGEASPSIQNVFDSVSGREWHLTGWNIREDGSGISVQPGQRIDLPLAEAITLYAQWEEVFSADPVPQETIGDGEEGENNSCTFAPALESTAILLYVNPADGIEQCAFRIILPSIAQVGDPLPSFTAADYGSEQQWKFWGWSNEKDGEGSFYAAGTEIELPAAGSLTLFAQWVEMPVDPTPFSDIAESFCEHSAQPDWPYGQEQPSRS